MWDVGRHGVVGGLGEDRGVIYGWWDAGMDKSRRRNTSKKTKDARRLSMKKKQRRSRAWGKHKIEVGEEEEEEAVAVAEERK